MSGTRNKLSFKTLTKIPSSQKLGPSRNLSIHKKSSQTAFHNYLNSIKRKIKIEEIADVKDDIGDDEHPIKTVPPVYFLE